MKLFILLAAIALLAFLFVCLVQAVLQHNKSDLHTARAKRYKVRFVKLNLIERLFLPFQRAMHWLFAPRPIFGASRLVACNVAEGSHEGGVTKLASAAIATRFLCVKKGADTDHIAVCSAITDRPMGICTDEPSAAEEPVNVALLGTGGGTRKGVASAPIASGALVATTAAGKLQTAVSTQYPIGRAVTDAAADGDIVEFDPINPVAAI